MLCALTVRTLEPGTFEQFRRGFMGPMSGGTPPEGWVRFSMVRSGDEVACFGFFDGTEEELRASANSFGYEEQQRAIAPYVKSVGSDAIFEVVEDLAQ